jgi:hypothetical protein
MLSFAIPNQDYTDAVDYNAAVQIALQHLPKGYGIEEGSLSAAITVQVDVEEIFPRSRGCATETVGG